MNTLDSETLENTSEKIIDLENITIKNYTHNDKKLLCKRITDVKKKNCYIRILKIIKEDNLKYTQNDNGIFFNLTNLSNELLTKIELILQEYENKKMITEQELIRKLTINTEESNDSSSITRNSYL
jgi:hypothetical protein